MLNVSVFQIRWYTVCSIHNETCRLGKNARKMSSLIVTVLHRILWPLYCYQLKAESTECIYFYPNYSRKTRSVQFCKIAKAVMSDLSRSLTKAQAFWSFCGNADGICSLLTWQRINDFVLDGQSPFDDDTINLQDYNHLLSSHSYKKYFGHGLENQFKNIDHWEDLGEIITKNLGNKTNKIVLLEISAMLNDLLLKELHTE